MKIGPVTIRTLLKRQGFFEVPTGMALHTLHLGMAPKEREFRLRVVKGATQARCRNLVPARGTVTRLAGLRKAAAVGIRVAIRTTAEGDSGVAGLLVPTRRVALLAGDLDV